jgi:hypothetical protein
MMRTDQLISLNFAFALFLYVPQKITLKKAASIDIHNFTGVLLSGASIITMLQVRAHAMLLFQVVWQRTEVWSYRGFKWFIVYTKCH